jgi:hypothetical protein
MASNVWLRTGGAYNIPFFAATGEWCGFLSHKKSCFTGSRLVSLPFSDHCEPLLGAGEDLVEFANLAPSDRWRYVELRPLHAAPSVKPGQSGFREGEMFWFHRLDLSPSAEELFCTFTPIVFGERSVERKESMLLTRMGDLRRCWRAFTDYCCVRAVDTDCPLSRRPGSAIWSSS